jgi:hypothetical protein
MAKAMVRRFLTILLERTLIGISLRSMHGLLILVVALNGAWRFLPRVFPLRVII